MCYAQSKKYYFKSLKMLNKYNITLKRIQEIVDFK